MLGDPPASSVTLQFGGDDLDPSEITATLGLLPMMEARRGEPLVRDGEKRGPVKTGAWSIHSEWNSIEALDQKIERMLCRSSAPTSDWRKLVERFNGRIMCHVGQAQFRQGFRLSSSTLAQLAERGLLIDFVMEKSVTR